METETIKEKKKIEIELIRKDGKTIFKFKVDPKITNLYSEGEVRESQSWPNLKFYYLPSLTQNREYLSKLHGYNLFDDYGMPIINERKLNIAWIRTLTGQGEIIIKDAVSFAELSSLVRNATTFIKEYFEEYFKDFKIKGIISVEV
mgnify:FL=1